jgi:hypothetical protein
METEEILGSKLTRMIDVGFTGFTIITKVQQLTGFFSTLSAKGFVFWLSKEMALCSKQEKNHKMMRFKHIRGEQMHATSMMRHFSDQACHIHQMIVVSNQIHELYSD